MATVRGALSDERYKALQRAAHLNPGVTLLPGNRAVAQLANGSTVKVSNSTIGVQLVWGCEGCRLGTQHYRICTSHALRKPLSLRCLYDSYNEEEWDAANRQKPWESEQLLMRELQAAQLSEEWCPQSVPIFWPAAVDFLHLSQKAVMQADGSSHFKDTFDADCRAALDTDMRFCVRAVGKGVSVIRVHDWNLRRNGFLAAASRIATGSLCVVLSLAYSTVYMYEAGSMQTYVQVLARLLPGAHIEYPGWGIVIRCKL
jgi:very-short-patch-repair endonuclease